MGRTTELIRVKKSTKSFLDNLKNNKDTYDKVIRKNINLFNRELIKNDK